MNTNDPNFGEKIKKFYTPDGQTVKDPHANVDMSQYLPPKEELPLDRALTTFVKEIGPEMNQYKREYYNKNGNLEAYCLDVTNNEAAYHKCYD